MRRIIAILAATCIGSTAMGQEFHGGLSMDYAYPHSGEDQTGVTILGGITTSGETFRFGLEGEVGMPTGGNTDYDTARARLIGFYDLGKYELLVAAGWTEYDFGSEANEGTNAGFGVQREFSDRYSVRGEFIRDFMDDSFTKAVTTTRIGVVYSFW